MVDREKREEETARNEHLVRLFFFFVQIDRYFLRKEKSFQAKKRTFSGERDGIFFSNERRMKTKESKWEKALSEQFISDIRPQCVSFTRIRFRYRERIFISLLLLFFFFDEISFRPTLMYAHRFIERNENLNRQSPALETNERKNKNQKRQKERRRRWKPTTVCLVRIKFIKYFLVLLLPLLEKNLWPAHTIFFNKSTATKDGRTVNLYRNTNIVQHSTWMLFFVILFFYLWVKTFPSTVNHLHSFVHASCTLKRTHKLFIR